MSLWLFSSVIYSWNSMECSEEGPIDRHTHVHTSEVMQAAVDHTWSGILCVLVGFVIRPVSPVGV